MHNLIKEYDDMLGKDRSGHDGDIAILNISYKRLYKYERATLEAMWIQINTIQGKIVVCCCHRPPDKKELGHEIQN